MALSKARPLCDKPDGHPQRPRLQGSHPCCRLRRGTVIVQVVASRRFVIIAGNAALRLVTPSRPNQQRLDSSTANFHCHGCTTELQPWALSGVNPTTASGWQENPMTLIEKNPESQVLAENIRSIVLPTRACRRPISPQLSLHHEGANGRCGRRTDKGG